MSIKGALQARHIAYDIPVLLALIFIFTKVYGATTISTNVQSDGNFVLSNSASQVQFVNGWKISQTTATTTQVSITDSGSNPVLILDEN